MFLERHIYSMQQAYDTDLVDLAANEVCGKAYLRVKILPHTTDESMIGACVPILLAAPWLDSMKVRVLERVVRKITKDGWE